METMSPSSSSAMSYLQEAANLGELSTEQSLIFTDSLNDLKNLRSQLYSAAEYFELSYSTDDHKHFVVNTLKDYAIKALVNTVDHLGSMSFKVNGLLDEKVEEVSGADLRVSCIEQRIQTCKELVDYEGISQQALVIKAPRYNKRYTISVGEQLPDAGKRAVPKYEELKTVWENNKHQELQIATRPTLKDARPSLSKKMQHPVSNTHSSRARSVSPRRPISPSPLQRPGKQFSSENRAVSSLPKPNPLARSGSLAVRSTMLNSLSITGVKYPSSPQRSISVRLHAERNNQKDGEQHQSKGKRLLKSLLSRRKSKKDDMLYNYLDEY